jgi:hypothetical protein
MRHRKTGKTAKKEGIFEIPHKRANFASKHPICTKLYFSHHNFYNASNLEMM